MGRVQPLAEATNFATSAGSPHCVTSALVSLHHHRQAYGIPSVLPLIYVFMVGMRGQMMISKAVNVVLPTNMRCDVIICLKYNI